MRYVPPPAVPMSREQPGLELYRMRAVMDHDSDEPVPPDYVVRRERRSGHAHAGAVLLGFFYAFPVAIAASQRFGYGSGYFAIPVAGPWLWADHEPNHPPDPPGTDRNGGGGQLIAYWVSAHQVLGLTLLAVGLFTKRTVLLRRDLAGIHVQPIVSSRGARGVAVGGAF